MSLVDCEHTVNRRGDDTGDDAAPTGVNRGDCAAIRGGDEHREAIGGTHGDRAMFIAADEGIGAGGDVEGFQGLNMGHDRAVHLVNPQGRIGWASDRAKQAGVVGPNSIVLVLNGGAGGVAEIQGIKRGWAYAAQACAEGVFDAGGLEFLRGIEDDAGCIRATLEHVGEITGMVRRCKRKSHSLHDPFTFLWEGLKFTALHMPKTESSTNAPSRKIAVFPGQFDPITNGHLDVIRRAAVLFDELIVAVGINPDKKELFGLAERLSIIRGLLKDDPGIRVEKYTGLTVDFVKRVKATAILRGIRDVSDLRYEFQLALANRTVGGVETVFIMTGDQYALTSSSLIRQVVSLGGDVRQLRGVLPEIVIEKLEVAQKSRKFASRRDDAPEE
jgi:pantetheine-phosphate adenylyltransferase